MELRVIYIYDQSAEQTLQIVKKCDTLKETRFNLKNVSGQEAENLELKL